MIFIRTARTKARTILYRTFVGDRRTRLYDLSTIKPQQRQTRSPVIQFYSSVDNIGNFTPVIGIQEMLGHVTDTWCIHDKEIDFDFINSNYKCAIIGGAGLLHQCFEGFWTKFLNECKIPVIIWGVGVCLPDKTGVRKDLLDSTANAGVDRKIVAEVAKKCELINVRDDLTAEYYGFDNADISACPTIKMMQNFRDSVDRNSQTALYSSHEELVSEVDKQEIKATIAKSITKFRYTDNIQRTYLGLNDIISDYYCHSQLLITTRLHGAIISYGLGIPYIAIARDAKMREFCRINGNGIGVQSVGELKDILKDFSANTIELKPIAIEPVLNFGERAKAWVLQYCDLSIN
ncbi:polysaccharide pyruvyl transferase family protein [Calothrix sp. PCC 6303]|uniref:polysaccharide pyruvyl transferase family protein n=1 Tax=Calothrix sp. PCC 6303 TaxID=1170562 RepID=UPI0002A04394|nr:polysaccharide pyruvyl transferase family protein [Calothrix sp. PCC 6303]AFZ01176.1 polysaccharide pyruvyl transferase [Calothrix sp. PCC 6303]